MIRRFKFKELKKRKFAGSEFKSTHANINAKKNAPYLGFSGKGFKDNSSIYLKYFMWLLL